MSVKSLRFISSNGDVVIRINELLDISYGSYLWPSSYVLCEYIIYHQATISGLKVLELGSGTGLPGLICGKLGCNVMLPDSPEFPEVLCNLSKNITLNELDSQVGAFPLKWGDFPATTKLLDMQLPELIIGSDTFYNPTDFEILIATVAFCFERNPKAKFITAYQERSSKRSIQYLLEKWDLKAREIFKEEFNFNNTTQFYSEFHGLTSVHILEITSRA